MGGGGFCLTTVGRIFATAADGRSGQDSEIRRFGGREWWEQDGRERVATLLDAVAPYRCAQDLSIAIRGTGSSGSGRRRGYAAKWPARAGRDQCYGDTPADSRPTAMGGAVWSANCNLGTAALNDITPLVWCRKRRDADAGPLRDRAELLG